MTNNNQQPPQENPNNQFSNNEPMTFAQKVEYVKSIEMTNNKQQTEIDAAELAFKLYPFSSDSVRNAFITGYNKAKEMEKEQKEMSYSDGYREGYRRALELTQWTISNLIPKENESK